MASAEKGMSPVEILAQKYAFEIMELQRWCQDYPNGLGRLRAYFNLQPPPSDLAFLAYEIVAELRHTVKTDVERDEVEFALSEIRGLLQRI
jgi:hypothetical protein